MTKQAIDPINDQYHFERKVGRYEGFPAKCSRKLTRQSVPYVIMKNILIIWATKLTLPAETKTITITLVARVAFSGSLTGPLPLLRKRFTIPVGKVLSPARACKVRGAIRIDPIAEESVAAPSPIGMMGPQRAILLIAN